MYLWLCFPEIKKILPNDIRCFYLCSLSMFYCSWTKIEVFNVCAWFVEMFCLSIEGNLRLDAKKSSSSFGWYNWFNILEVKNRRKKCWRIRFSANLHLQKTAINANSRYVPVLQFSAYRQQLYHLNKQNVCSTLQTCLTSVNLAMFSRF